MVHLIKQIQMDLDKSKLNSFYICSRKRGMLENGLLLRYVATTIMVNYVTWFGWKCQIVSRSICFV